MMLMLLVHVPPFGYQASVYYYSLQRLAEERVREGEYDEGNTIQILLIIYKYLEKRSLYYWRSNRVLGMPISLESIENQNKLNCVN